MRTQVGWLIDSEMFDGYRDAMVAAIRRQGHACVEITAPQPPYRWDDVGASYRGAFAPGACVVAHGDIEFATRVREERRWAPGAFCSVEEFSWSNYACSLSDHLLNDHYVMLPFGELSRRGDFLFDTLGHEGRVFVRPDSPLKLFAGQVVTRATFEADLEFMGFYDFPRGSLVVVSPPQALTREWRFVIANRSVVAGCLYKRGDVQEPDPSYDPAACELAQQIAEGDFQPDRAWIVDICQTAAGELRVLEIGGFSFSDLYACDMDDVVAGVSRAALAEWEDANNAAE